MQMFGRLRRLYMAILSSSSYKDLVHVVKERVPRASYGRLLGRYRAVLSPPGRGYDCCRTWEALCLGPVPLVVKDDVFDERLFLGTEAAYIPRPMDLTPEILRELLDSLE